MSGCQSLSVFIFARAPGLAAALHHVRDLIVDLEERKRSARFAAAAQLFARAAQRGKIAASAAAVFEEHRLAHRQPHDVFHRVVDRLDETGAALRIFVLGRGALGLPGFAVVRSSCPTPASLPMPYLMKEADVEPNRAVERAILIGAEPGQLVVENFGRFSRLRNNRRRCPSRQSCA